jgi:hypothetical protein
MGEALNGGSRGAHQWWGGMRQSRKMRSSVGEGVGWRMQWHEVGRAAWGRSIELEEAGREGGRRGVERVSERVTGGRAGRRDAQGRTSGAGSVGQAGGAHGDAGGEGAWGHT